MSPMLIELHSLILSLIETLMYVVPFVGGVLASIVTLLGRRKRHGTH